MGLLRKEYTCPKCGKTYTALKWGNPSCPYCKPTKPTVNYDLIGVVPTVGVSETQIGLIEAGQNFAGAHVWESYSHPVLMAMATRHAQYQASRNTQGHQLFSERVAELQKTMTERAFAEICAESWKEQKNDTKRALGDEFFKCWKQSPGHWSVASKKHKFFGADMALGSNGIWYGCIIVAD
jgi:hypothetical protein